MRNDLCSSAMPFPPSVHDRSVKEFAMWRFVRTAPSGGGFNGEERA